MCGWCWQRRVCGVHAPGMYSGQLRVLEGASAPAGRCCTRPSRTSSGTACSPWQPRPDVPRAQVRHRGATAEVYRCLVRVEGGDRMPRGARAWSAACTPASVRAAALMRSVPRSSCSAQPSARSSSPWAREVHDASAHCFDTRIPCLTACSTVHSANFPC